ncbi:MAG: DUF4810 domain-containing protein [Burkholderiaceae bacterium]|nr:DUF4810 domain-containing protein [Burkholderiaceae bacterium]
MTGASRWAGRACFAAFLLALTGCAATPKPLYQWGTYQRQVYESMKGDGTSPTDQLGALMAQAEKARANQESLPPGFRAHVGLVQLRLGQDGEARSMFEAEKVAFPEATTFMDFLLKRMTEKKS